VDSASYSSCDDDKGVDFPPLFCMMLIYIKLSGTLSSFNLRQQLAMNNRKAARGSLLRPFTGIQ
jgi:hypothetical protein